MSGIESLRARIESRRRRLLEHEIYQNIGTVEQLRRFMESHVFAVWDFMSLLKSLQQYFCPTAVPWVPPAHPLAARLINEIVLGEETDESRNGGTASHFQLYRQAMKQCGADHEPIDRLVAHLQNGGSLDSALQESGGPTPAQRFVRQTFETIQGGEIAEIAAAFTFGREDLLPDVFQCIVDRLNLDSGGKFDEFLYYLDRHIELDADQHGPMAEQLISSLCGDSPEVWEQATRAAEAALDARLALWDGLVREMAAST